MFKLIKQLMCKHIYEEWLKSPKYDSYRIVWFNKCVKCGKEVK